MVCQNDTDTCREGKCQCGETPNLACDTNSQLPMCNEGKCVCTKIKGSFEVGNGKTQGSCSSRSHKCHASGICAECISSSDCDDLSDTCANNKCVCGERGSPCNGTISNHCRNGNCMCGSADQCFQANQITDFGFKGNNGVELDLKCTKDVCFQSNLLAIEDNVKKGYCGCYWNGNACKMQRSDQEVCQQITKFYNPLFIMENGNAGTNGTPTLKWSNSNIDGPLGCDDVIGDRVGEYHCLGNIIFFRTHCIKRQTYQI